MTQHRGALGLISTVGAFAAVVAFAGTAAAQAPTPPPPPAAQAGVTEYAEVPPNVEGAPVAVQGGYCYGGPHPTDASVTGTTWDDSQGRHIHPYPPIDLRLFAVQDNCYYFIGDPSDFGYRGQTYQYYGAHPVYAGYGGGWCFMIGGHHHAWRPWSPYFVVAGPWFYWQGPYDPYFWNYWPYYAVYYHHYYPNYYRGGRYYRHAGYVGGGGGFRGGRGPIVAPPIGRVAAPVGPVAPARAAMPAGAGSARGGGWSTAAPARAWPSASVRGGDSVYTTRSAQPSAGSFFRGSPNSGWGGARAAPMPSRAVPAPSGSFIRGNGGGGWGGGSSSPRFTAPSAGRGFRR